MAILGDGPCVQAAVPANGQCRNRPDSELFVALQIVGDVLVDQCGARVRGTRESGGDVDRFAEHVAETGECVPACDADPEGWQFAARGQCVQRDGGLRGRVGVGEVNMTASPIALTTRPPLATTMLCADDSNVSSRSSSSVMASFRDIDV